MRGLHFSCIVPRNIKSVFYIQNTYPLQFSSPFCNACTVQYYVRIKICQLEYTFIASYYRQLSTDIKIKNIRLKPVLSAPRGAEENVNCSRESSLKKYLLTILKGC